MELNRAALAGAIDLSNLRKDQSNPATKDEKTGSAGKTIAVPSLVMTANEQNIREFLALSNQVPVLVEIYSPNDAASTQLAAKLDAAVTAADGRLVLVRIDADASPALVDAFGVSELPAVLALLQGQPAPLFTSDQTAEVINNLILRLIHVAEQNGLNSVAKPDVVAASGAVEPQLSPIHQAAYDAIEAGNYELAKQSYEQALRENPGDKLAQAGLAQVNLLIRTSEIDFDQVLAQVSADDDQAKQRADALVAIGNFAKGFQELLDWYHQATDQKALVKHLLELFEVVGADSQEVITARRKLSLLLF